MAENFSSPYPCPKMPVYSWHQRQRKAQGKLEDILSPAIVFMSPLFLIFLFREEILKGIERLKYSIPAGHEHIYLGLRKVRRAGATFALKGHRIIS